MCPIAQRHKTIRLNRMNRNSHSPDAIFFDLGNVLVTFDWNIAIPRLAAQNGNDPERVKQFLADPLHDAFERNEFGGDEFYRHGVEFTNFQGSPQEFQTYWNEVFGEIPQNVALLRRLAARLPVYALSNTNPWHAAYLEEKFDWMSLFKERFYSFTLGARKPDPKIYLAALKRSQLSPNKVLFIDDRQENISGARELGFQTILLPSPDLLAARLEQSNILP